MGVGSLTSSSHGHRVKKEYRMLFGSKDIESMNMGSTAVTKVMLGNTEVWSKKGIAPYIQESLKDGPLGLWMLDDETAITARDSSENKANGYYAGSVQIGTLSAPTRQLSRTARTTNGRAVLPVSLGSYDTITVEFWVRQINYASADVTETLIEHTANAANQRGFLIYSVGGQLRVYVRTDINAYRMVTADTPPAGQWYFYSIVMSRTTPWIHSIRRNGVDLTLTPYSSSTVTGGWESPSNLYVGQWSDGTRSSNAYFTGVAIYPGALSNARRDAHYYSSFDSYPLQPYVKAAKKDGAISLWMMDERYGNRIVDQSGQGRHGTHTGGTITHSPDSPTPQFDGSKYFVGGMGVLPTTLGAYRDITVEFWWKPEVFDSTWVILELTPSSADNHAFNFFHQYSTLTSTVRSPGVSRERHMWPPTPSQWYFVSLVFSRASPWPVSIRMNGTEQPTTTTGEGTPGPSWASPASLYVNSRGNATLSGTSKYTGLTIYPRQLTEAERDSHYLASFMQ